jgi:ABC-type uncharacterized transport system involved in gliding motility auxiliary subunit
MSTSVLAIVGLVTLAVAWIIGFVMPQIRVMTYIIVGLGAALVAAAVVLDFRRVSGAIASRRGLFGFGAGAAMALVLGIVLMANAISVRVNYRFDFTGLSQFTLTTQTKEVLEELEEPVEVVSFFNPTDPRLLGLRDFGHNLLAEYQNYTDLLTLRVEDPELRPDLARQYRIGPAAASLGTMVFVGSAGRRQVFGPQIGFEAEHAFTSALLEVTGTKQRIIYFLTGHGESEISGDYDSARSGLRDNLFQVAQLDLLRFGRVPDNAAALVIAGPRQPISASELAILEEYLQQGGRMLLLLNPDPQEELRELLRTWWLEVGDGTLVDPASHVVPNVDNPLVPRTRNNLQLTDLYFPGVTAVMPLPEQPEEVQIVPLAWTTPVGWQEIQPLTDDDPQFDPDEDMQGPLAMGVLLVRQPPGEDDPSLATRLAVIGDSDFAANQHFRNGGNSDLFLTLVNQLAFGEEIISVDRKVLPVRRLVLSPEEARFFNLSSAGLLPLLVLIVGALVWWRRR